LALHAPGGVQLDNTNGGAGENCGGIQLENVDGIQLENMDGGDGEFLARIKFENISGVTSHAPSAEVSQTDTEVDMAAGGNCECTQLENANGVQLSHTPSANVSQCDNEIGMMHCQAWAGTGLENSNGVPNCGGPTEMTGRAAPDHIDHFDNEIGVRGRHIAHDELPIEKDLRFNTECVDLPIEYVEPFMEQGVQFVPEFIGLPIAEVYHPAEQAASPHTEFIDPLPSRMAGGQLGWRSALAQSSLASPFQASSSLMRMR